MIVGYGSLSAWFRVICMVDAGASRRWAGVEGRSWADASISSTIMSNGADGLDLAQALTGGAHRLSVIGMLIAGFAAVDGADEGCL
ncbi:hypothetical protein KCP77_09710 [Salmonella enterica subsp. enterica]|nr:hypothetical protein KCP77_09710 [Salmonella enterica subsp. enterica]